uniref:Uncharacterized protein n=1 Tax=Plectus sambesii TaxID=2011161 RepID=A0A914X849_9BILA
MKYRLNGGWFATCALSFIIIILLVEFGQSIPLVRRRRYSSLSEQTLAHHNRHKNAKSQSDDLNGLTSARVADGVL